MDPEINDENILLTKETKKLSNKIYFYLINFYIL